MHCKTHFNDSQEGLRVSTHGHYVTLIETKRQIKSASSDALTADFINQYMPSDPNHYLMHVIAMGAHEFYGPNANCDAWTKKACMDRHPTFVTHGHFFEEHNNRNYNTQGRGLVKASRYCPHNERVELLIEGHRDKSEEIYQMAKQGKQLSFSMSARLPFDTCSICGNEAPTRAHYCDHAANHMGEYLPEFKKFAFVYNPDPTFFDISRVKNPADKIAHYLEYRFPGQGMSKAASHQGVISGADWGDWMIYNGMHVPDSIEIPFYYSPNHQKLLSKLAAEEKWFEQYPVSTKRAFVEWEGQYAFRDPEITDRQMEMLRKIQPDTLWHHLAKRASFMSLPMFYSYIYNVPLSRAINDPVVKEACACCLPSLFSKLFSNSQMPMENLFNSCSASGANSDPENTDAVQNILDEVSDQLDIRPEPVTKRTSVIIIKSGHQKLIRPDTKNSNWEKASSNAQAISQMFGIYKLAALEEMIKMHPDFDDPQIVMMTVLQNQLFR